MKKKWYERLFPSLFCEHDWAPPARIEHTRLYDYGGTSTWLTESTYCKKCMTTRKWNV